MQAKSYGDKVWLLLMDLDGTLWDHLDISSLNPPFTRINDNTIVDSNGVAVRLYNDAVRILKWARASGAIVSTLSWNHPSKAIAALEAFGLKDLFDYLVIEPHPYKGEMARKLLEKIRLEKGLELPSCRIIYIDDRDIHIDEVRQKIGNVVFLRAWRDFKSYEEAKTLIEARLGECG